MSIVAPILCTPVEILLGMAERLNNIAYQQTNNAAQSIHFNPRSVSLDIRTPEELAAVNEFLVTLGRDVSGTNARPNLSPETYFDTVNLSQLGLTGMPGIGPTNFSETTYPNNNPHYLNNNNPYHSSRSSHPPAQYNNNVYTDMNEPSINYSTTNSEYRRQSNKLSHPPFPNQHYHTPPLESSSPHSAGSSPATSTPPQLGNSMPDNFDYLRASRGAPAVAHLAPPEYMSHGMPKRSMIPLKALPGASPTEPQTFKTKLPLSLRRPPTSPLTLAKPGSLYPLLTSGDIQYKLPPLNKMYRSSSTSSRESSPSSTQSSPIAQPTVLPGIRSIARPTESDDLDIGRIDLERSKDVSQEERKRHAKLILDILVSINRDFKNRRKATSEDVEMMVA